MVKREIFLVPGAGLEPARPQGARDFESKNRVFPNPLTLGLVSRNYLKILR